MGWALLLWTCPSAVDGQERRVRGVVRDASTGRPLAEVLVRGEPTGSVTLTDADGSFTFPSTGGAIDVLSFQRLGYAGTRRSVDDGGSTLVVHMAPSPLPMEGFEVRAESFETRFAALETALDRRLARYPGVSRVVDAPAIRPFDDVHGEDPWKPLRELLGIEPGSHQDSIRLWWGGPTRVRPDVYIDDRPVWLFQLIETPWSSLCRMEVYRPGDGWAPRRTQIRAYTCFFLAQVADAQRTLRARLHWGDLIAGPWIG